MLRLARARGLREGGKEERKPRLGQAVAKVSRETDQQAKAALQNEISKLETENQAVKKACLRAKAAAKQAQVHEATGAVVMTFALASDNPHLARTRTQELVHEDALADHRADGQATADAASSLDSDAGLVHGLIANHIARSRRTSVQSARRQWRSRQGRRLQEGAWRRRRTPMRRRWHEGLRRWMRRRRRW